MEKFWCGVWFDAWELCNDNAPDAVNTVAAPIPEPGAAVLFCLGALICLAIAGIRRR